MLRNHIYTVDTASEITLLGVSAVAIRPHGGGQIKNSEIIILPALFTCGMALVDSVSDDQGRMPACVLTHNLA